MLEGKHLPRSIALGIMAIAIAACFGQFLPDIGLLVEDIKQTDSWNSPEAPLRGLPKYIVLVVTGAIAGKQLSYYYIKGGTKGAVFSTTIFYMNALERSLDWLLAIEGALLLPWSTCHPTTWVFGFFLYCVVALARMIVTLRRSVYAEYWSKHELEDPLIYPWSTYPFHWVSDVELHGLPPKPEDLSDKEFLLWVFKNSLLAHHIPIDTPHEASVREILWGWRFSFLVHGTVAFVLGILTIVSWVWLGAAVTRWVVICSASLVTLIFCLLSKLTFRVGKKKFGDIPPQSDPKT